MASDVKVVTNPVSLSKDDISILVQALTTHGNVVQRRINNEVNPSIKKLLSADLDVIVELRVRLAR